MLQFRDLPLGTATFESNIPFTLRFMIDTKVGAMCVFVGCLANATRYQLVGMNWIEVPAGAYTLRSNQTSHCQLEFNMK